MKTIVVTDVTDVHKVAVALQRAVNEVLNADALKRLMKGPNDQEYEHIYPGNRGSALGGASILVGGVGELQDVTTLHVTLKRPGGYNQEAATYYVPTVVIARLCVRLDGGRLFPPHRFTLDGANSEARATLRLPTQTFRRYPNALVQVV